jgi:hypothetical protein
MKDPCVGCKDDYCPYKNSHRMIDACAEKLEHISETFGDR